MNRNERPTATPPKTAAPKIEKADFTMTVEEYVTEFTREGVTKKDLEKYAGKRIAVTGRVTMFSTEKNGTAPPYVVLGAPELKRGVVCYLDDDALGGWKNLRTDKIVTVQGFEDEFPSEGRSPALSRCVVLEAN